MASLKLPSTGLRSDLEAVVDLGISLEVLGDRAVCDVLCRDARGRGPFHFEIASVRGEDERAASIEPGQCVRKELGMVALYVEIPPHLLGV